MDGPDSSYSCFDIHIVGNIDNELMIEPPIQAAYIRSDCPMIRILGTDGMTTLSSFSIRSGKPVHIVVPI